MTVSVKDKPVPETRLDERAYLSVEVFETLDDHSGLAISKDGKIIMIKTTKGLMYDGRTFNGSYRIIGIYCYSAKSGDEITVPIYVSLNEYKDFIES